MIKKQKLSREFGQIPLALFLDARLSSNAKCIYSYISCRPEGWTVNTKNVMRTLGIKHYQTYKQAIEDLESAGWLKRVHYGERDEDNSFKYDFHLFDLTGKIETSSEAQNAKFEEEVEEKASNGSSGLVVNITNVNSVKINKTEIAAAALAHLNSILGTKFSTKSKQTLKLITQRIDDGYSLEEFKSVHNVKAKEWINDEKYSKYLAPSTLYAAKNFSKYLEQSEIAQTLDIKTNSFNAQKNDTQKLTTSNNIENALSAAGIMWQQRVFAKEAIPEAYDIFGKGVGYLPDYEIKPGHKRTIFYFVETTNHDIIDVELLQ